MIERPPSTLVGIGRRMSRVADATPVLWRTFGPRIREIPNRTSTDRISMQVYAESDLQVLDPAEEFVKWACVEVRAPAEVPDGMREYRLGGGLYAVFEHRGPATDLSTYRFIFGEWLGSSGFELDHREHFEVLPAGYDPFDPQATEDIWLPVRPGAAS